VKKRLGFDYNDAVQRFWDRDYEDARETTDFEQAFNICKSIGVIDNKCTYDDIPLSQTGNIILIGKVFKNI
jgi:hypothetical protein